MKRVRKSVAMKKTKPRRRKGVTYAPSKPSNLQPLRNLSQSSYPEVLALSEKQAEKVLLDHGVLPAKKELGKQRVCWNCKSKLKVFKGQQQNRKRSSRATMKKVPAKTKKKYTTLCCYKRGCLKWIHKADVA